MAKARRSILFLALGASVAFTVLLLLLVEFVAGFIVGPVHPQEIPGDAVSRTVTWLELNPAPLVRDVDLLWRNQPGAKKTQLVNPMAYGRRDEWTIENNSEGFRGAERTKPAPGEKLFRILCVGDSITFGFSVDQPDSYPAQLQRLLAARYPDRHFEVINAGVPGWSWLQGLRFLDLREEELAPDLVIIGHGTNDQFFPSKITDEERFRRLSSFGARTWQKIAAFAAETNTYRAFARGLPTKPEDVESEGCKAQRYRYGGCRRVTIEQIATAVHEVSEMGKSRGVPLIVANTDFAQTVAVQGALTAVDADGIPYVDLVAQIEKLRRDDENERATRLGLPKGVRPAASLNDKAPEPRRVVLRVQVPDASLAYRVTGTGNFRPNFKFEMPLKDDGTGGDEKAGDGVFSATVDVVPGVPAIEYLYAQGETLEFAPVPPFASGLGDRVLQVPENGTGPIEVFGQSLYMVERAHPNRDGHRLNARLIAGKIEELPAFRAYVQGARRVDEPARD